MNYVLQVLFILVLMAIGFVARKRGVVSETGTSEMVRVLIAIIYPCLIFSSVTRLRVQECGVRSQDSRFDTSSFPFPKQHQLSHTDEQERSGPSLDIQQSFYYPNFS
jgi:hypothetical protein